MRTVFASTNGSLFILDRQPQPSDQISTCVCEVLILLTKTGTKTVRSGLSKEDVLLWRATVPILQNYFRELQNYAFRRTISCWTMGNRLAQHRDDRDCDGHARTEQIQIAYSRTVSTRFALIASKSSRWI